MPNQKISELTAIVTVDNSVDVLPIVDISANTTKKVTPNALKTALALDNVNNTSDANKPVSTAQQDALNAKVTANAAISPATKPKITFDAKGLVTSGDLLDETDIPTGINANKIGTGVVSTTEFEYLNGVTSAIQTQIDAKQATLVSGTNIKTINGATVLGAGDITIAGNPPSGVSGAIQFSNGSAFASDAANLFWDNTNKRLGIGTNVTASALNFGVNSYITYNNLSSSSFVGEFGINNCLGLQITGNNPIRFLTNSVERMRIFGSGNTAFGSITDLSAMVGIKGSGSTSATTSLLVQNSAGSEAFRVYDDRTAVFSNSLSVPNASISTVAITCTSGVFAPSGGNGVKWGSNVYAISSSNGILKISDNSDADFNRLQFGGTSSAYPSLKRSSTTLQARLADDSGYAPIDASLYKVGGTNGFTGTGSYTNFTIVGGIITNAS